MKNKIQTAYPQSVFHRSTEAKLYIADFTERTGHNRKVEFHTTIPQVPGSTADMDCLVLENPLQLPVLCNIFDDNQFKSDDGNDLSHCECVFFPETELNDAILAFVEIKDCKSKNISVYKNKVKEQIITTAQIFREKSIIENQRVYGIVSFPRKNKVSFNQTIFDDFTEYKKNYQKYKVHFLLTNSASIINEKKLTICSKPH